MSVRIVGFRIIGRGLELVVVRKLKSEAQVGRPTFIMR